MLEYSLYFEFRAALLVHVVTTSAGLMTRLFIPSWKDVFWSWGGQLAKWFIKFEKPPDNWEPEQLFNIRVCLLHCDTCSTAEPPEGWTHPRGGVLQPSEGFDILTTAVCPTEAFEPPPLQLVLAPVFLRSPSASLATVTVSRLSARCEETEIRAEILPPLQGFSLSLMERLWSPPASFSLARSTQFVFPAVDTQTSTAPVQIKSSLL